MRDLGENAIHKAARDIERLGGDGIRRTARKSRRSAAAWRAIKCRIVANFSSIIRTTPDLDHDELAAEIDAALESEVHRALGSLLAGRDR